MSFDLGDKVYVWAESINDYATDGTDILLGEVIEVYNSFDIVRVKSVINDSVFLARIGECYHVGTGPSVKKLSSSII